MVSGTMRLVQDKASFREINRVDKEVMGWQSVQALQLICVPSTPQNCSEFGKICKSWSLGPSGFWLGQVGAVEHMKCPR